MKLLSRVQSTSIKQPSVIINYETTSMAQSIIKLQWL